MVTQNMLLTYITYLRCVEMFVAIAGVNLEIAVIQASFLGKLDKQKLSNTIINNNL